MWHITHEISDCHRKKLGFLNLLRKIYALNKFYVQCENIIKFEDPSQLVGWNEKGIIVHMRGKYLGNTNHLNNDSGIMFIKPN
jgi:hypothetical protein